MLNESVIKVLKNAMWDLATCADGEPNVVPVAFKDVTEDGKLVVGDVFLETTLKNIKANEGEIAISVCMGTACFVRGAEKILEEFENRLGIKSGKTTLDGKFSLDILRCIGACGIAPVVLINNKVYKKVEAGEVKSIVSEYM